MATAPADRRFPPLEGGRNLRDMGGYPTADGRHVRWGLLYRSGTPAGLTEADWAHLSGIALKGLCDLRNTHERERAPFRWADAPGFAYWSRDCASSFGALHEVLKTPFADAAAARDAMIAGYRVIPGQLAPAYAEIFRRLAAGKLPMMFNCSAGKDRAGTAAALILDTLGVPRETVLEDYAISNRMIDIDALLAEQKAESVLARQSPEVVRAVMLCEPAYLEAAFDEIEQAYGSVAGYVERALGITPDQIERMRANLLE